MNWRRKRDGTSLRGFRVLLLFVCVYNGYTYSQQHLTAIKLKITDVSGEFSDETVVYFQPSASEAYDRSVDALKLISPNQKVPSLFSRSSDRFPLSVNALPDSLSHISLSIFLKNNLEGKYTMKMYTPSEGNLPKSVYLYDINRHCSYNGLTNFPMNIFLPLHDGLKPVFYLYINRTMAVPPEFPACMPAKIEDEHLK